MAEVAIQTLKVALNEKVTVRTWDETENKLFDQDWDSQVAMYTKFAINAKEQHVIRDLYDRYKEVARIFGQYIGYEVKGAGNFLGMGQSGGSGYVMTQIRPDFMHVAAHGRTFDYNFAALTKDNWYGVYHNGVMPAAVGGAVYLRDWLGVMIIGLQDTGGNPAFDEFQWDNLDGKSLPINNAVLAMRGSDLPIYESPSAIWLKPGKLFRLQGKVNVVAAAGALIPHGIAFVKYEDAINQQPTQLSTVPP